MNELQYRLDNDPMDEEARPHGDGLFVPQPHTGWTDSPITIRAWLQTWGDVNGINFT